ncbi:MAG: FtsQ-type POTRA domain-containing protein [Thermotaleaceae bacterium]
MYINKTAFNRKLHRRRKQIMVFILLLCCIISFIIIFKTDIFSIEKVTVNGNTVLTEEEVVHMSGINIGNQIFKEKTSEIRGVLLQNPYIKEAHIKRRLPNRIIINIAERQEVALVPFMDVFLVIDEEGMVLKSEKESQHLKSIVGLQFDHFMEGEILDVEESETLKKALEIIKGIDKRGISISGLDVTNRNNMVIRLTENMICRIGDGTNMDYRLKLLDKILIDLASRDITRGVIDINYEGNPTYRPVD